MKFWRKWLGRVAVVCGVLMSVVAVAGFFLPASLIVERERLIPVPAPDLYERTASLKRWPEWAVWWEREPFLEVDFAGPDEGTGAAMTWTSKSEGEGRGKITGVSPNREVALAFDFGERGDAVSRIRFEESADQKQTLVRWKFRSDFGGNTGRRYFGMLFRTLVEKDMDASLARLEAAALAKSKPIPTGKAPAVLPAPAPATPPAPATFQAPAPTQVEAPAPPPVAPEQKP